MRVAPALAAALALAPMQALAMAAPTPGSKDSRVRIADYDPGQVYAVASTGLAPVEIILDADEQPKTIAGMLVRTVECNQNEAAADKKERTATPPTDWMAMACDNVLLLVPLHRMDPSILFLRTVSGDGTRRTYNFELHTRDGTLIGGADPGAYMNVRFRYPSSATPLSAGQKAAAAEAAHARTVAAEEKAVANELAVAANTGPRNKDYWMHGKGCPALAPLYAYDDGVTTTLGFAPRSTLPAFSTVGGDRKETVLNVSPETMSAGTAVHLPGVYQEIRLRAETQVCALTPHNPQAAADPIGRMPGDGSGTVSPHVRRELRAGR